MVQIGHIEHLQVHPLHAGLVNAASLSTISAGVPTSGLLAAQFVDLPADRGRAPGDLGVVAARAHHEARRVGDRVGGPGSADSSAAAPGRIAP